MRNVGKTGKILSEAYHLAEGRMDHEALIRKAITMTDSDCKAYLARFIRDTDEAKELVVALHNLLVSRKMP